MSTFKTSIKVDWLRWTVGEAVGTENATPALKCFDAKADELRALPFYSAARKLDTGRIDWCPDRLSQGVMVTLTGKDLRRLRSQKQPLEPIMRHIQAVKGRVTRIDVALDVFDSGISVDDFSVAADKGQLIVPSKKRLRWESKDQDTPTGVTIQFGSRQSERLLRIYDKGAEQGTGQDVIRIELEVHGRKATSLMNAMVKYGINAAGIAAIKSFVDGSGYEPLLRILSQDVSEVIIEPAGRKETNHYEWVWNVALPAVLMEIKKGDEEMREVIRVFIWGTNDLE